MIEELKDRIWQLCNDWGGIDVPESQTIRIVDDILKIILRETLIPDIKKELATRETLVKRLKFELVGYEYSPITGYRHTVRSKSSAEGFYLSVDSGIWNLCIPNQSPFPLPKPCETIFETMMFLDVFDIPYEVNYGSSVPKNQNDPVDNQGS